MRKVNKQQTCETETQDHKQLKKNLKQSTLYEINNKIEEPGFWVGSCVNMNKLVYA